MKAAPDTVHGKKFEREMQDAFHNLYLTKRCLWERVIDSAAAGNLIRKADADFKLVINSRVFSQPYLFHLECKASIRGDTLQNSCLFRELIKSNQVSKMRQAERAGAYGIYMFHGVVSGDVEVWPAYSVNMAHPKKRVPLQANPAMTVSIHNLGEWARQVVENPDQFLRQLQRHDTRDYSNENKILY